MAVSSVYIQLPLFPVGKACCVCRAMKPYDEFYRDKRAGDGHARDCMDCAKRRAAEWRAARRDELNAAKRTAYHANREQLLSMRRAYDKVARLRNNARQLRYHHANKEQINARRRERAAFLQAEHAQARQAAQEALYTQLRARACKTCTRCGAQRPITAFSRDSKSRDGRCSQCKACIAHKGRSWYETHRAIVIARARNWAHGHPDYLARLRRRQCQRRRARQASAVGRHSDAEWQALCAAYKHVCVCCGGAAPLTEDHVVPLSKGGSDWISNIQPLCRPCNSRKGDRTIRYIP